MNLRSTIRKVAKDFQGDIFRRNVSFAEKTQFEEKLRYFPLAALIRRNILECDIQR